MFHVFMFSRLIQLFLQLIHPSPRRRKLFVLDQRLIDDSAEVGAAAAIAGGLNFLHNLADGERLSCFLENICHSRGEAHFVSCPPAAPARAAAAEGFDSTVELVEFTLKGAALLSKFSEFTPALLQHTFELRNAHSSKSSAWHKVSFLN